MADLKTVLLGAAAVVMIAGSAMAIESDDFTYATKQTGYLSISPSELQPLDARDAANFRSGGSAFTSATDGIRVCGAAPLHLPQGALVQSATMQYSVGAAGSTSVLFEIYRRETFANKAFVAPEDYEYLVGEGKQSTLGAISRYTEKSDRRLSKIDNEKYLYTIRFCTDFSALVYSAQIKYSYTTAGD